MICDSLRLTMQTSLHGRTNLAKQNIQTNICYLVIIRTKCSTENHDNSNPKNTCQHTRITAIKSTFICRKNTVINVWNKPTPTPYPHPILPFFISISLSTLYSFLGCFFRTVIFRLNKYNKIYMYIHILNLYFSIMSNIAAVI